MLSILLSFPLDTLIAYIGGYGDISWCFFADVCLSSIGDLKRDSPSEILIDDIASTHYSQLCKTTGSG